MTVPEFRELNPEFKSDWSIYDMVRRDLIPNHRVGKRVFIDLRQWERFKERGGSGEPGRWRQMLIQESALA